MGTFSADISKFVRHAKENADKATRLICYDLFSRVMQKTPVDEGTLRKSWVPSTGAPATGTDGENPLSYAMTVKYGEVIYLTNNQPYAAVVEYGGYPNPPKNGKGKTAGGYSIQAPAGMVRISIPETVAWANKLKL